MKELNEFKIEIQAKIYLLKVHLLTWLKHFTGNQLNKRSSEVLTV